MRYYLLVLILMGFAGSAYADARFDDLRSRALAGDAKAQNDLGFLYERGRGVPQDYQEAVYWYRLAVNKNLAEAQYNLAIAYYYGQGVRQSYAESERWFLPAAKQSHVWAQYYLGLIYAHGRGVAKNEKEAALWFGRAAEQGHAGAHSNFLAFKYDRKWRKLDGTE